MWRAPTGRALRVVGEALFYRGGSLPKERIDFVERAMLALLDAAGPRARVLFLLCLFGLMFLAPLWLFRLPTLNRLPLEQRILALSRMEESPLGAPLVLAIKAALCVLYYEQPEVLRESGTVLRCLTVVESEGKAP